MIFEKVIFLALIVDTYVVVGMQHSVATTVKRSDLLLSSLACCLAPLPVSARPEWVCELDPKSFKIEKRQQSSVRIRPEQMLIASDETREVKLLKVPLGRSAASSFDPEEQFDLSKYFSSRQAATEIGDARIAQIFKNSLQRQVASPTSPLQSVDGLEYESSTKTGRRYVSFDYVTDSCRRIDEDGACVGRSKRYANSVITVSLESQARTNEEQRRMDAGDMEQRYIDTLWLFTATAPATTKKGVPLQDIERIKQSLHEITNTFRVTD